jgi:glycosyltransferase involved in cell wall biosynthesis
MSEDASFLKRGLFQLRHTASHSLTTAACLLAILENVVRDDKHSLIVIDDYFPHLGTAFRIAEINYILNHFNSAIVYSTCPGLRAFREYAAFYPHFSRRVRRFHPWLHLRGSAAYIIFLNNAFEYLHPLERAHLPFVFELYPGGGFHLNGVVSDAHLRRVMDSPMFRKVIVTQRITRDYLLDKKFCRREQIEFVYGGVFLCDDLHEVPGQAFRYGINKQCMDICFVANKYTNRGIDKGYDRFIECARILHSGHPQIHFHVVGTFAETDVALEDLRDAITFYGPQFTPFFPAFYSRMDLIVSPNMPFLLAPGAFDGFPPGCCIEAALCGAAVFLTDPLGLNEGRFKDREDVVIISPEPAEIASTVEEYLADPARLARLAQSGERAVRQLFALDAQMVPRLRVLSELLAEAR